MTEPSYDNPFDHYLAEKQRMASINDDIRREMEKAHIKHPRWPKDELRQAVIVAEEAGEALQAMLNLVEYRDKLTEKYGKENWVPDEDVHDVNLELETLNGRIDKEMLHTGAMVLRFLLYRRALKEGK